MQPRSWRPLGRLLCLPRPGEMPKKEYMYKLMQKYSKRVMGVLSIVLMVTFVVAQSNKPGNDRTDPAVATVAGKEVHSSEMHQAREEWDFLNKNAAIVQQYEPYPGMPPQRGFVPIGMMLGREAAQQILRHPDMY